MDYDDLSERFEVADADNFREHVQDDGAADARDDVFGLLAVALLGNDRAVHEDRAAASEFGGVLRVEGEFRDFFHGDAERLRIRFDERSTSRRARLVEDDARDDTVVDGNRLHVLAAYIEDEGNVRSELLRRVRVGDRFDGVIVGVDGPSEELFAVAGRSDA